MAFAAGQGCGSRPLELSPAFYPPPPLPPTSYDDHYVHHHQPPPPAMVHVHADQERIHTLFVSGLPEDVKAREIHNLFRRRPGFDHCLLEYTGRSNQVVAFVTFFNHQSALAAMSALNGVIFDPQAGATLRIELARSNSRNKHPRGHGAYVVVDKRVQVTNCDDATLSKDEDSRPDNSSGTDSDDSSNNGAFFDAQSGKAADNTANDEVSPNEQSEKHSSDDIPPCSTLFIANLGPTCTKEELEEFLSGYSGFLMLKMRGRGGVPVAFADFKDVKSSAEAMKSLHGKFLGSSDRGGLHVEYARSKMRKG